MNRPLKTTIAAAWLLVGWSATAHAQDPRPRGASSLTPLAADVRKALDAVRRDPHPEKLIFNSHYVVSNELRQYLYRPKIKPLGGIFIGVGAEQNYLLSGWARPEILVVVDFDEWIADLHVVYGMLFQAARTPQQLIALWSPAKKKEVEALIQSKGLPKKRARRLVQVFKVSRVRIHKHLRWIQGLYKKANIPTFLTSQQQYDYIAALHRTNRVLAVRGDYTGKRTLRDLAAVARRFKIPVRLLYLSNVEYYFAFNKGRYRKNILDLPFGKPSLVLHTAVHSKNKYRYVYHSGANFQRWLRSRAISGIRHLVRHGRQEGGPEELVVIDKLPEEIPRLRRRLSRAYRKSIEKEQKQK